MGRPRPRRGSRPGFLLEPQRSASTSAADSIIGHGAADDTGADRLKKIGTKLSMADLDGAGRKAERLIVMGQHEIVTRARTLAATPLNATGVAMIESPALDGCQSAGSSALVTVVIVLKLAREAA